MRYFSSALIANSRIHGGWWNEVSAEREFFHLQEEHLSQFAPANFNEGQFRSNAAAILPRDAWLEFDNITRRVMRDDEGQAYMTDLMALAKPVHIGKLVHMNRVSSDAGTVVTSMSGQVPVPMDKVQYKYEGTPVPIFATAFGREWREWNTLQSENFDALSDDAEAHNAKINSRMADYALNGDTDIKVEGSVGYGILNHPNTKLINLGTAAGGGDIDLTTADGDAIDAFLAGVFGAALDANLIQGGVNLYVSPEIGRNLDRADSGLWVQIDGGYGPGLIGQRFSRSRRINKVVVTHKLTGNQFFAFVPNASYIRPLIGMAVNTTAMTRLRPTDNYQFLIMGAMGIDIRSDYNGKSGVFASTVVD